MAEARGEEPRKLSDRADSESLLCALAKPSLSYQSQRTKEHTEHTEGSSAARASSHDEQVALVWGKR